jgi:hypothetical protein
MRPRVITCDHDGWARGLVGVCSTCEAEAKVRRDSLDRWLGRLGLALFALGLGGLLVRLALGLAGVLP